jgi:hypothetical protein
MISTKKLISKMKRKFVNVTPLSSQAKNRFENIMGSFHACEVEEEKDGHMFLISLNKKYCFWVQREGNDHWKIEK